MSVVGSNVTRNVKTTYIFVLLKIVIGTLQKKMHTRCEIVDFVETHLCKLCVILRPRVLLVVCAHNKDIGEYSVTIPSDYVSRRTRSRSSRTASELE